MKKPITTNYLDMSSFGNSSHIPEIREIDIINVTPNPNQPRKHFDDEALAELGASIKEKGLLQPIIVQATEEDITKYIIVAGERRFRAISQYVTQWSTIPCIVTTGNIDELALIENIQRVDLSPLEEARAVKALIEKHNYTLDIAAPLLGKSKSSLSELLSLTKLSQSIQDEVDKNPKKYSKSLLLELSKKAELDQEDLFEGMKNGKPLTVREIKATKNLKVELSHEEKLAKAYDDVKKAIAKLEALGGEWG